MRWDDINLDTRVGTISAYLKDALTEDQDVKPELGYRLEPMSKIGTTVSPFCNGTELTLNATSSGVWE